MEEFQYHKLPNGMSIVHRDINSDVAYCGVAVRAGSRDELAQYFGLAHFVEHTIFKGTTHRKSWHIINRMERVGGELNAYTSKEETMVYSSFPAGNYPRAVELMGDLISNSIFPTEQLEKEREVVLDELDSYRDIPAEAIYDDFEDMIFAGDPLAHNILGMESTLQGITSSDCRRFLDELYVPENMVFFSMGHINFDRLCRLVERHFGAMNHSLMRRIDANTIPEIASFHKCETIDSHQSHTLYGARVPGMYDNIKYPLLLLTNIVGGAGMNSLFNVELREKRGYVYTVEAATNMYSNTGLFSVYYGCDTPHVATCNRIIGNTLDRLAQTRLSESRLNMAKRQYAGQMLVASDNRENTALNIGKSMLYFGKVATNSAVCDRIMSVTAEEVRNAAALLVPQVASTLTFS